ncbi:MAG: hypothetical protein PUD59_01655 [bacterium]|nr:hypothetical protein [bacterium]
MKKKLKLFVFVLIALFAGMIGVNALEVNVTSEDALASCLATKDNTCILTNDISLNSSIDINVNGSVVLDLNGHTIKTDANMVYAGGMLIVFHGTTLTVNDSVGTGKITTSIENDNVYAALQLTKKGENDDTNPAKIIVNGGNIVGYYYGLTGNGSNVEGNRRGNTEVIINGGKIESIMGPGIYQPQIGTMTINQGEIKGITGLEIRSGKLIINNGTIIGSSDKDVFNVVKNGNGTTTDGVGIAVVQHTTKNAISIEINGGTIRGYHGLYEMNVQENENIEESLTFKITGGTFEGLGNGDAAPYSIYVEDLVKFVSGGTYNIQINNEYLANDTIKQVKKNNVYVVEENKVLASEDDKISLESKDALPINYSLEIKVADKDVTAEVNKNVTEAYKNSKVAKDVKLLAVYDISVLDENDEVIPIEDGSFKVSIAIGQEMQKYDVYKVVYIEDGKIKETLDAKLVDGKIVFTTTHFSEYAVVGYNNVKVENPKTLDNIALFISIASVGAALTIISSKKLLKNM